MIEEKWVCEYSEEFQRRKQRIEDNRRQKLSTFDFLSKNEIWDVVDFEIYEVSYKNGSRKEFCKNINNLPLTTGDWIIVNTGNGYNVGRISLSGDLVRLQMKKKKVNKDKDLDIILRPANDWEMDKMKEARALESKSLIQARAITASLNLDMKIGDVEYQGDKRKATFYYTSDGRVDFRELVKVFAKEFKVKIEMRQIGIRQESSKIGGIASCGRELCCSTWHTSFSSVTTEMVRYQNLSVNQSKLTGLCGRLKCCLNYELDTYLEALENFPKKADVLKLQGNNAYLVKLDIFKGIMYYSMKQDMNRAQIYALTKERVQEILDMNKKGERPLEIGAIKFLNEDTGDDMDFADVTGQIELPEEKKPKKRRGNRRNNRNNRNKNNRNQNRENKPDNKSNRNRNQNKDEKPTNRENRNTGNPNKKVNPHNKSNRNSNHNNPNKRNDNKNEKNNDIRKDNRNKK
jgi:cell fate regulator YaaT (PSP1 superfamily)